MNILNEYIFPDHLAERIRILSDPALNYRGEFVLYWMHHAVRAHENPALDTAVLAALHLKLPLLVYQGLGGNHRFNSDRHHTFIMQGAKEVQKQLSDRGIRYCFHLAENPSSKSPLLDLAKAAALVISEDFPAPPFPRWLNKLADSLSTAVWAVDTHCLIPMQRVGQPFKRAYIFRDAVREELYSRLPTEWQSIESTPIYYNALLDFNEIEFNNTSISDLCAQSAIDHSIGPVHHTKGGSTPGYNRWNLFKQHGLSTYHTTRNNPIIDFPKGASRMSPYLHHGHVSPFRISREAFSVHTPGSEKYLDELIIWRELAFNFCFYRSNLESISILPAWARNTLKSHAQEKRAEVYPLGKLELGETENDLWNTAQKSLLIHGELHNNVRMTWGKALLQWTQDPQEALDTLIYLNHKYALDGSDPNSYGGILWCLGLFDRPFPPEKAIYGTVRTRPLDHHAKRLNLNSYSTKIMKPSRSTPLNIAIIGAGLAGLAAARSLKKNGEKVTVFDKSRGPGGRMATRRVDGLAFDHGAQYFTVRDSRFEWQVDSWLQEKLVQEWTGAIGSVDKGTFSKKEISTTRYVGTPRMSSITRHLSNGLNINYSTRINNADFHSNCWHLVDDKQNKLGSFDALIVNTPPIQALPFLVQSPSLKHQAEQVDMLPCWAVMVSFSTPLAIPFDGLFVKDNPLSWICRNSSKPGRPPSESWILHGSPEWSTQHLEIEPGEALDKLLAAFFEATGIDSIKPTFAKAHRWRYALAKNPLPNECLWDKEQRLAVCGDWCNSSRVEGAYLSGIAAAGRLLGLPDQPTEYKVDVQLTLPGL